MLCKGCDVRSGVPVGSGALCLHFAWQARHLVLCKGRDVRSGVPVGSGAICLHFAWQARHLVLCKGIVYAPASLWDLGLFACILRGSRGTWGCLLAFCVAGSQLQSLDPAGIEPGGSDATRRDARGCSDVISDVFARSEPLSCLQAPCR